MRKLIQAKTAQGAEQCCIGVQQAGWPTGARTPMSSAGHY